MKYREVAWVKTAYVEYDAWPDAEVFVLLHGRWWSHKSWIVVGELLHAAWYSVLIPDVPWFGETPLDHIYTIDDYAARVHGFIDASWLQDVYLLWHSNGWRMSIQYLSWWDWYVKKLFLVNAAAFVHPPSLKQQLFTLMANIWKKLLVLPGMPKIRELFYRAIWWHDYLALEWYWESTVYKKWTFLHMIATDLTESIPHIDVPSHIIRWAKDTYTPLADGKRLHDLLPWSTFDVFLDEKHWIHLTNPSWLVEKILSYC